MSRNDRPASRAFAASHHHFHSCMSRRRHAARRRTCPHFPISPFLSPFLTFTFTVHFLLSRRSRAARRRTRFFWSRVPLFCHISKPFWGKAHSKTITPSSLRAFFSKVTNLQFFVLEKPWISKSTKPGFADDKLGNDRISSAYFDTATTGCSANW